jgi:DNA-binding CsgD family transcriptional regulator
VASPEERPTRLLDRDRELAAVRAAVDEAADGRGSLVMVEGAPGVGKSELLAAARAHAVASGVRVLVARGAELESEFPFGMARQLFEPCLADATRQERQALFRGSARLATPLFASRAPKTSDPETFAATIVEGLAWLTANLTTVSLGGAAPAPVLLAVDDAQWVDESSLRFLARLVVRLEQLPVALLVAARTGERARTWGALETLATDPGVRTFTLRGLGRTAVEQLLASEFDSAVEPAFVDACLRATGGNPFMVRALVDTLKADGVPPVDAMVGRVVDEVPESVLRAVLLRLRRLGPGPQALARALAILGDGSAMRHCAALAELPAATAEAAADRLMEANLVEPALPLSFRHGLIAAAVGSDLAPLTRHSMHRRAAQLLAASSAPVERVAAHLLETAPDNDAWVRATLQDAAREATARGDPRAAVRLLERALEESPDASAELLLQLAHAEAAAGLPRAIDHLGRALALIREPAARATALRALARAQFFVNDPASAVRTIAHALHEVDADEPLATDMLCEYLAAANIAEVRVPAFDARFTTLVRRSATAGDEEHIGLLVQRASVSAIARAPRDTVRALAERARSTGQIAGVPPYGLAFVWLAVALLCVDDAEAAELVVEDGRTAAERDGSIIGLGHAALWRGMVHQHRGRLDEATVCFEHAIAMCESGFTSWLGWSAGVLALAHIDRGDLPAAASALQICEAAGQDTVEQAVVKRARGRYALAQGRPAEALQELLSIGEHLDRYGLVDSALTPWRSDAALAACAAGERSLAIRLTDDELAVARPAGAAHHLGAALRARGRAVGGHDGRAWLDEAVDVLTGSQATLLLAEALADAGTALRASGDVTGSRSRLMTALELAQTCGAGRLSAIVRRELHAAGLRPRRANRARHGLTATEERVARLAASGNTNAQIAGALVVSVRTVEWHLARVYRKLGVRRDGLATFLRAG